METRSATTTGPSGTTALSWSISKWEGLPGGVSIAPDTATTLEDLDVADYFSSTDGYCGLWNASSGGDVLRLNDYYFNGATTSNRRACMLHEWGHAHGLAHSYSTQVMDSCPVCPTSYTTPQSHDISDYNYLWRAMTSGRRLWIMAIAAVIALAGGYVAVDRFGPERYHTIRGSYYFDVTNRQYVAGFSDAVVLVEVNKVLSTDVDSARTTYEASVIDDYTGKVDGTIAVDQVGYRDGRDIHGSEDQELLEPGETYVLAIREKREARGDFGVVGGPLAVSRVDETAGQDVGEGGEDAVGTTEDLERIWRQALRDAEYPPGAPD